MNRIIIAGITGRTGNAVARVINKSNDFQIVAAVGNTSAGKDIGEVLDGEKNNHFVYPDVKSALEKNLADIYIDFTTPEVVEENAEYAIKNGLDIIIGTTGLKNEYIEHLSQLIKYENKFGIFSSNFALGIAFLEKMGKILCEYFNRENLQIIETHHKSKLDSPSGTAIYLRTQLDLNEESIISKRVSLKKSMHEISYNSKDENLSISYEVSEPEAYGDGVMYVLKNMYRTSGIYYDLASFMLDIEKNSEFIKQTDRLPINNKWGAHSHQANKNETL